MRNVLIVGILLAAILFCAPASAEDVIGILRGNLFLVSVDSIQWTLDNAPFPVWENMRGEFVALPEGTDTFHFRVPVTWPLKGRPYYTLRGEQFNILFDPLEADTWYPLPDSQTVAGSPPGLPELLFTTRVGIESEREPLPGGASRLAAAPNPSGGLAVLSFELEHRSELSLDVFDRTGRAVVRLLEGSLRAGRHSIEWNGTDATGRPVGTGVYLVRLSSAHGTATAKLLRTD